MTTLPRGRYRPAARPIVSPAAADLYRLRGEVREVAQFVLDNCTDLQARAAAEHLLSITNSIRVEKS